MGSFHAQTHNPNKSLQHSPTRMNIQNICILGGAGFVGSSMANQLSGRDQSVRVLTRKRERAKHLILLPGVEVVETDVHDSANLVKLFRGMHAVINLTGILHERKSGDFNLCHVELPGKIARACIDSGVSRFLHMSALGASLTSHSAYQRSKAAGEATIREILFQAGGVPGRPPGQPALDLTIFRPSVIFGRGDSFISLFARLLKTFSIVPLACPNAKFQPVWVEDVARAFVESLEDIRTVGNGYDLCGPRSYSLKEIVEYAGRVQGLQPRIIGLDDRLSYLLAWAMEHKPGVKLMTRDNYFAMQQDNVCSADWPLGFPPTTLEAIVPDYLGGESSRGRYGDFREHARRH
jgi:uncharacterized protein YbjT (DUF2867 family)